MYIPLALLYLSLVVAPEGSSLPTKGDSVRNTINSMINIAQITLVHIKKLRTRVCTVLNECILYQCFTVESNWCVLRKMEDVCLRTLISCLYNSIVQTTFFFFSLVAGSSTDRIQHSFHWGTNNHQPWPRTFGWWTAEPFHGASQPDPGWCLQLGGKGALLRPDNGLPHPS